jgi:acyl-CoA reductase-like NAD-dependent aldehyde dehydrogenase
VNDSPSAIRQHATKVLGARTTLAATTVEGRARWLADSVATLLNESRGMLDTLSEATGLSPSMVEWATRTTLDTAREDSLLELARDASRGIERNVEPVAMLSVVLAGNVFTASIRGIVIPLLLGVPVLVKASSRETLFPALLRDALRSSDAGLGASMSVVAFPGGDVECEAAFVESAEVVSVYGGDDTVAAIAARIDDARLIAHGHGVSVAYCGSEALEEAHIGRTIESLSLDVCAYDQRGCLSPQLIYVEESSDRAAADFARRLGAQGLGPLGETLPRGPLPGPVGAVQAQWRGMAEVEGVLVRGDTHAVAIREPEPIRWSPGYRNVTVAPVRDVDEATRAMEAIGSALKCVGTDPWSRSKLEARLSSSGALSAYACAIGEMQTPPLDAPADGLPIWHGLLRS